MGSATFEGFHALTKHAGWVTVTTGLRSNFVFDGDLVSGHIPLVFDKTTATSYQIRNYDGDIVASGALSAGAPPTITDAMLTWRGKGPYGWYRGYLFGTARTAGEAAWGTAYGDFSFYRVATSSVFPANPTSATAASGLNGNDEIAHAIMGVGAERVNGSLPDVYSWGSQPATATAATGTSVAVVKNGLGNGSVIHAVVFHTFIGDPSQLATPTVSGPGTVTWTLESRITKNSTTISCWSGDHGSTSADLGTVTFSSGALSGTHELYYVMLQNGDWSKARTAATSSGTSTTGTVTSPIQGFTAGRQKIVFAATAVASATTFSAWTTGYSKTAMTLAVQGDQPAAPNSIMSVASNVLISDASTSAVSAWSGSKDYATMAIAVCAGAGSGLPSSSTTLTKTWWNNYALSARPRKSVVLFADGPSDRTGLVANAVSTLNPYGVVYEPYNEPLFTRSIADYITYELVPFYTAAKAADSTSVVLGGCNVSWNSGGTGLTIIDQFLTAALLISPRPFDGLSVHAYNSINGDIAGARTTLVALRSLLVAKGLSSIPVWQTEQGQGWQYGGQIWPRLATTWTSVLFFMCELYGIPIEQNVYWYDVPHGFDGVPVWWIATDGPGPQALPIRTMVTEIGNRTLSAQLDFGDGQNLWAGGTWAHLTDGTKTVGFMAGSFGQPDVRFATNQGSLVTVDAWGNTATVTASGGYITVPSSELPTWIRVPNGATCTLASDWSWGTNLAAVRTISSNITSANGTVAKLTDGTWQNQYLVGVPDLTDAGAPFADVNATTTFPATVTLDFGRSVLMSRVVVACPAPWQTLGAPTAFVLEYFNSAGAWVNFYTMTAPTATSFSFTSGDARCTSETYWSQQHNWVIVPNVPLSCAKIRMTVTACSQGPFENSTWTNNGQAGSGTPRFMLREFQAFASDRGQVLL